jgi:hypothetical protein
MTPERIKAIEKSIHWWIENRKTLHAMYHMTFSNLKIGSIRNGIFASSCFRKQQTQNRLIQFLSEILPRSKVSRGHYKDVPTTNKF